MSTCNRRQDDTDRSVGICLTHADKDVMPKSIVQRAGPFFFILLFAGSGTLHFMITDLFASIISPSLPLRREAVYISGACELAGTLGLCLLLWRRQAGIGLFLLTFVVTPTNIYMWLRADLFPHVAPSLLFWRLPLQLVLLTIIWRVALATTGISESLSRRATSF
jgi:uncharacterized membrane protein